MRQLARVGMLMPMLIAACQPPDPCGSGPVLGCGDGFTGPVPLRHDITPWPPREGEVIQKEVLVLGPNAEEEVRFESCAWDPWKQPRRACSRDREPLGSVFGGHGFVSYVAPSPGGEVPSECSDPDAWQIWSGAEAPIPAPGLCDYAPWHAIVVQLPGGKSVDAVTTDSITRDFEAPRYPSLAEEPPLLTFEETESTLRVDVVATVPEDAIYFADSQLDFGNQGLTAYVGIEAERGGVTEASPRAWARPKNGQVSAWIELALTVELPLRLAVTFGAKRAFPEGQSTAWVFEVDRTPSGEWTTRTLLPSGDLP